jgi:hypothetical protein
LSQFLHGPDDRFDFRGPQTAKRLINRMQRSPQGRLADP